MSGLKTLCNLTSNPEKLGRIDRTSSQELLQALATHILHGDERHAIDFVDLENGGDIGMAEPRRGAGLLEDHSAPTST